MRTLIYSDVHGNLPAFEAILKDAGKCDNYICLGDLVNYGPWSNECVDLALSFSQSINIIGNHEESFISGKYPGSNSLVQQFFKFTFPLFLRKEEIKKFVGSAILGNFICLHTLYNAYIYPDTNIQLNNNYIVGHSHHQFVYNNNSFKLYNAGSVGQNRKFINVANYLIYNEEKNDVEMKAVKYDIELLLNKMKTMCYPGDCINYYKQKARA